MKIGVNCRELLSHRMEGIARYTWETTRRLVLDHPEDEFYFFFDRAYDEQFIIADNITPVVIHPQARHPILWYLWFEQSLPRALKKHKIDVLYSGDTFLSLNTDVPTVLVCHDIAYAHYPGHIRKSHLRYYKKYFPKFHHRANHIVAVSEATRQDIIKQYNLPPEKVTVGYNATPPGFAPVSDDKREELRAQYSAGNPYFIYVGSLHPRKNVPRLIQAFDKFKSQSGAPHKLVLVGRYAWKNKELQATYNSIQHKEDIVFTGSVHEGIQPLVASSEGLFYVSLFEGFGIPILEGFSSGVPVVTSNISSMPEVAGDCGILVDPTNVSAIASAMAKISKGEYTQQECDNALARAATFTWKATADEIYARLMEVAK